MKMSTIALCIATLSLSSAAGMANANSGVTQPMQQQTVNMTDAKLLKFSIAMDSISQINSKYKAMFQDIESKEQAQKIQQQAQSEMLEAVKKSGLSVEEYSVIAKQAQQDEQLRDRIISMSRDGE